MSLLEGIFEAPTNPLGVVEDIATDNNWAFERSGEDEVTIVSRGDWTDYQLSFTGMVMYRQALVLPGGLTASTAQCESMLVGAIHACERYYPAFQFVVWAGKT